MYLYSSNEFTTGYIQFNLIRLVIRLIACVGDCSMMSAVIDGIDSSNRKIFQFDVETLITCTTSCCVFCCLSKLFAVFTVECCGCGGIETFSDILSLVTLWIGEIPNTGLHLLIVCTHTKAVYPDFKHGLFFGFMSIYKLVERLWGIKEKYDWRTNVWHEFFSHFYIWGIIIQTASSLLSIAIYFM